MTTTQIPNLTDADLIAQVTRAATRERSATAHLIALLAELDARNWRRRTDRGRRMSPSLDTYCAQVLHLSEHAEPLAVASRRRVKRARIRES